ncbi:MAG: adenosine deaminase [Caldilineaceae bacterium]
MTQQLDPELSQFIAAMPKVELHIHLEGSIQPQTVLTLAQRHRMLDSLPSQDLDGLRRWFTFTDFPHFVDIYFAISNLLREPEDFATIVYDCGADMSSQNIRYRELTFTPYNHTHVLKKGLTIQDLLQGLEAGRQRARRDFGVEMRWIFDIPRNASFDDDRVAREGISLAEAYDPSPAETTLAYALQGRPFGVIGFGLGGYEVDAPPEPFAHAFRSAIEQGFLSVPHAGETMGVTSIWGAIQELGAVRIGHGVRAIEDPALLTLLKQRQIVLEINPTSNICLHVYRRLAEHPFPHLDRMGLLVTVNSDDPPLFNTTLNQEYGVLAAEFGYGKSDLVRIARNAYIASAAPPELKATLLAEFEAWVLENLATAT